MSGSLQGRRALISAGAAGIGRVIAQQLTDAGARCKNISGQAIPVDRDQTSLG